LDKNTQLSTFIIQEKKSVVINNFTKILC